MKIIINRKARRPVRANYTMTVDERVREIRITDEDLGNMSVTNDLEQVLCDVALNVDQSLDSYSIVYRDSTGTWDRIIVTRHKVLAHVFNVTVRPGPRPSENRDNMVIEDADRQMFGDEHVELGLDDVGDK